MSSSDTYKARQFDLSNLKGISDETLEMHFKLYEGYVKETNKLNEKISEFVKGGKVDQDEFAEYSELNRRLGFEYNGMVLHEYYFDNLKTGGGTGDPNNSSPFRKAAEQSFGSYDVWEHAYLLDYKPADRPKYIEAFFSNIDWSAIDKRLHKQMARQLAA